MDDGFCGKKVQTGQMLIRFRSEAYKEFQPVSGGMNDRRMGAVGKALHIVSGSQRDLFSGLILIESLSAQQIEGPVVIKAERLAVRGVRFNRKPQPMVPFLGLSERFP